MNQLAQSVSLPGSFFSGSQAGAQATFSNTGNLINRFLPNIIMVAGIIFFLLILGSGFAIIRSAGGSPSPQDAAKAKSTLTFAVVGFLLVVSSFFILEIIKETTGVDFITPNIP